MKYLNTDNKVVPVCRLMKSDNGLRKSASIPHGVDEYLYEIYYYQYSYADGQSYLVNNLIAPGYCSGVRKANLLGRDYDWYFSNNSEFVVHSHCPGLYKSVGVASSTIDLSDITPEVEAAIPMLTLDGINEHGFAVTTNVVPAGDLGHTGQDKPGKEMILNLVLPRILLDHCKNVDEAIDLINSVNVFATAVELHLTLNDKKKSVVVEFIHNKTVVIGNSASLAFPFDNECIMTNFYLAKDNRYQFIPDMTTATYPNTYYVWEAVEGKYQFVSYVLESVDDVDSTKNYYKYDETASVSGLDSAKLLAVQDVEIEPKDSDITPYGSGVERYLKLHAGYEAVQNADDMMSLMKSVSYERAYSTEENPVWYTEFVANYLPAAYGDLTVYRTQSAFADVMTRVRELFDERSRTATGSARTWQTIHTAVYDLDTCTMQLSIQEDDPESYSIVRTFTI